MRLNISPQYSSSILLLNTPPQYSLSILPEIPFLLPGVDVGDVLLPLLALGAEVVVEDVVAQGFLDDVVLLELVERLGEVRGELADARAALLAVTHGEDVLVDRRPRVQLALHAVEPNPIITAGPACAPRNG